jgi:hypothetical protein
MEIGNRRKEAVKKPFSGQLTDFNAWSRPLTIEEMISFAHDCDSELVIFTFS